MSTTQKGKFDDLSEITMYIFDSVLRYHSHKDLLSVRHGEFIFLVCLVYFYACTCIFMNAKHSKKKIYFDTVTFCDSCLTV